MTSAEIQAAVDERLKSPSAFLAWLEAGKGPKPGPLHHPETVLALYVGEAMPQEQVYGCLPVAYGAGSLAVRGVESLDLPIWAECWVALCWKIGCHLAYDGSRTCFAGSLFNTLHASETWLSAARQVSQLHSAAEPKCPSGTGPEVVAFTRRKLRPHEIDAATSMARTLENIAKTMRDCAERGTA